jgi:sulfhydrogenase subunit beta (sulfur reductase)
LFGTARGAQALQGLPLSCAAATQRPAFLSAQEPAVVAQFPADGALRRGIAALNAHAVPHAQWQQLGTECITCSGCSNVCPTCSCFATRQENRQGADLAVAVQNDSRRIASHDDQKGIATVRFWDSCLYEGFQREASGHNPSQAAGARIERYWTHKFGDAFVARFGRYTCVGCGRCDRVCPSGIGATAALKRIGEAGADNVESNGSTSP